MSTPCFDNGVLHRTTLPPWRNSRQGKGDSEKFRSRCGGERRPLCIVQTLVIGYKNGNMQFRYLLWCSRVCWCVLAVALASFCVFVRAQNWEETSFSSVRFLSDLPPAPADFDGDRVVDPLIVDRAGWPLSVEIRLSRTREASFLPVDPSRSATGSLTVRDLDHDGDTDLVWKGVFPLAPPAVIVWLNDGTGRFARLLSLHSSHTEPKPGRSLRKDAARRGFHYEGLPSSRSASSASLPTSDWTWKPNTSGHQEQGTVLPFISFLKRHPSDRGPPTLS
jgi:hypothetical protein